MHYFVAINRHAIDKVLLMYKQGQSFSLNKNAYQFYFSNICTNIYLTNIVMTFHVHIYIWQNKYVHYCWHHNLLPFISTQSLFWYTVLIFLTWLYQYFNHFPYVKDKYWYNKQCIFPIHTHTNFNDNVCMAKILYQYWPQYCYRIFHTNFMIRMGQKLVW